MLKINNNTPSIRLFKTIRHCLRFEVKIEAAAARLHISANDRERINALFGLQGFCADLPLSDMSARIESLEIFSRCVGDYFRYEAAPDTPVHLVTFVEDSGLTTDLKAELRLHHFRGKVDRAIRKLGLNAIVAIEVQVLTNYSPDGRGQSLMLHAHAIMWGDISNRSLRRAIRERNESGAWTNHFGAKPILRRTIHGGADEIEMVACYLMKLPYSAKRRVMKANDQFRFVQHFSGYRNRTALRIMEGLSHYSIGDAIFSVADGKLIRREWISELRQWHRERMEDAAPHPHFDPTTLWERIRAENHHGNRYQPFRIE